MVPVFSMSNRPEDMRCTWKLLQHEAKKREVELIFRRPGADESVEQIKLLGELR